MNKSSRNFKATSLLNISLGFYLLSIFVDPIIKCNVKFITYFGMILALLLIILGLCNYFIVFKRHEVIPDKRYAFFSLIIGVLFLASTLRNLNIMKTSKISGAFGFVAAFIAIFLGFILLNKRHRN